MFDVTVLLVTNPGLSLMHKRDIPEFHFVSVDCTNTRANSAREDLSLSSPLSAEPTNLAPGLEALIGARVLPMFPELLDEAAPIPLSVLKLAATLLVAHPAWVADIER